MPMVATPDALSGAESPEFAPWLRRLVSEPLLHFTLLGALVFAAHHLLAPVLETPTIEVSAAQRREFDKLFEQRQGRAPSEAEHQELVRRYAEDEALFREGQRLSLVQTDPALRAQLIARMRGMLQAEIEQTLPRALSVEERKQRTSSEFQAVVARLTAQWRVRLAEQP